MRDYTLIHFAQFSLLLLRRRRHEKYGVTIIKTNSKPSYNFWRFLRKRQKVAAGSLRFADKFGLVVPPPGLPK
jgi:hypothetical protein